MLKRLLTKKDKKFTIKAEPREGYTFSHWTASDGSRLEGATKTLTSNKNETYTAHYSKVIPAGRLGFVDESGRLDSRFVRSDMRSSQSGPSYELDTDIEDYYNIIRIPLGPEYDHIKEINVFDGTGPLVGEDNLKWRIVGPDVSSNVRYFFASVMVGTNYQPNEVNVKHPTHLMVYMHDGSEVKVML